MKAIATWSAIAAATLSLAHGATFFGFDSGTLSVTTGDVLPASVTFDYAYYETEDEFGDPLANPGFRTDSPAMAGDPSVTGYGAAISGTAIDATVGPVMLSFSSPITISGFGIVLDNSTMGTIPQVGGDPAFGTNILFYDASDVLVGFVGLDQTVSGFTITNDPGTFENVSKMILPSGAYYDNMSFVTQPVPEPGAAALGGLGLLTLLRRRRA